MSDGKLPPNPESLPMDGKACCSPPSPKRCGSAVAPATSAATGNTAAGINLPGGPFLMGTNYAHGFPADGEGPVRTVTVEPFAMDATPVTNKEFAAFVQDTGYVTEAEHFGWSFVFWSQIPRAHYRQVVEDTVAQAPWWCKVPGAAWHRPYGPLSTIAGIEDHPVVHVSWNDAAAYAAWAGKRLPTEAEWEYAGRGGRVQQLFPWGDELQPAGEHRCNVWQGQFPSRDDAEDGYAGTCPVRAFAANDFGLYSVAGNTWEWCADWFGTGDGRVMKGGSFLCHASYCNRYRLAARTQNSPDSSASNIGFRCASSCR